MNRLKSIWIIILAIAILETACTTTKKNSTTFEDFPKENIVEYVTCKKDAGQSYALYLPSSYSKEKSFPAIFIFDSHGNGRLPIRKYKELAEKYSIILLGSNNSKNGLSAEQNTTFAQNMIHDARTRINIDSTRIYTMGFSGGARVASSVAINIGGVKGVIACSGGFPQLNGSIQHTFDFMCVAGIYDFNYNELFSLNEQLNQSPLRHYFLSFNGKHEWSPLETIEEAIIWIRLNEMKDKQIQADENLIKNYVAKKEEQIKKADILDKYQLYQQLKEYLSGIYQTNFLDEKIKELTEDTKLQEALKKNKEIGKKEQELQQSYIESFQNKDLKWWKTEFDKIEKLAENSKNNAEKAMYSRMIGFFSIMAYSQVNNALTNGNKTETEKYLQLYQLVDKNNPDVYYFYASYYAKSNDTKNAEINLQKAIDLGFTDMAKIKSDPLMAKLKITTK